MQVARELSGHCERARMSLRARNAQAIFADGQSLVREASIVLRPSGIGSGVHGWIVDEHLMEVMPGFACRDRARQTLRGVLEFSTPESGIACSEVGKSRMRIVFRLIRRCQELIYQRTGFAMFRAYQMERP